MTTARRPIRRRQGPESPAITVGEPTLIVPFYRNPLALWRQMEGWCNEGFRGWRIIVVDDGSPETALGVFEGLYEDFRVALEKRLRIYRIGVDVPWNRGGARNLGAHVAETPWILHADIDHFLPADAAKRLLETPVEGGRWYRFPRWRVGKADETRRKDVIPDDCEFGRIHPHVDSYLIERKLYWEMGGYNERFSGVLGGGGPFLKRLERYAGGPRILPDEIPLHVYTRSVVADASDCHLSRNPAEFAARKRTVGELSKPIPPLNFPWERVL